VADVFLCALSLCFVFAVSRILHGRVSVVMPYIMYRVVARHSGGMVHIPGCSLGS